MVSDDEYLERLVAGIHSATSGDADVQWNEKINGRQFDVVVRFKFGTLRYLVLIEVKNRKRPASAADVEAFTVKARDNGADKAVFVTAAGYQEGAKTVASRHKIELYTVTFDEKNLTVPAAASLFVRNNPDAPPGMKPEFSLGEPELVAVVDSFRVIYANGKAAEIPSEQSQMNYYMPRTKIRGGRSLMELVEEQPVWDLVEGQRLKFSKTFLPATKMTPPDDYFFPAGRIKRAEWEIMGTNARMIRGNIKVDPGLFASTVVYTNVLTGESLEFPRDKLPLGDGEVEIGAFYFIYHPLIYYRCDAIEGSLVRWTMVESFQAGDLARARFTQEIEWARSYIRVTDPLIIERLKKRLSDYEALIVRDAATRASSAKFLQ